VARKSSTQEKVYEAVCQNPGRSTYSLSKQLGISGGSVRYALTKLKEQGLVRFKFDRSSVRIKKLSYPINFVELLPKSLTSKLASMISLTSSSQSSPRKRRKTK